MAVGFVLLYVAAMLTCVCVIGTNASLYYSLQKKYGVEEERLREADDALAAYLRGDGHALENTCLFGERELAHMRDVYVLFVRLRAVMRALYAVGIACVLAGLRGGNPHRAAGIASVIFLTCGGILGIWAAADFTGLFTLFHRIAFSNDLWLLDPDTELLIRICPEGMFSDMLLRILLWTVCAVAVVPLATALIRRKKCHEL